jgi:hypothetical protein
MDQKEDENLEDYPESFLYNLQKLKHSLNFDFICSIFLKDIHDEYIDILNITGSGDIYPYHLNKFLNCLGIIP